MKQIPSINFVEKQRKVIKIRTKRTKLINSFSFFTLAIYLLFLILTISYSGVLSLRLASINKKIGQETSKIEKLSATESKYLLLKRKTSSIMAMTDSSSQNHGLIGEIFSLFPMQLSVKGFSVDKDNVVSFEAATTDPKTLFEFINNINQYNLVKNDRKINMAQIDKLSISTNGDYNFGVKLKVTFL